MDIRKTARNVSGRKSYDRPVLKVFGPVGVLTQSGSGANVEAVMNGMVQMNMNRLP